MIDDNKFDFTNLPNECKDSDISPEDFRFINSDEVIKEQRLITKPTTFLKDSFKRFCKNKSSVTAGIILGVLLLLSFVIPLVDQNDIYVSHTELTYLEPKLFPSGTGFWDGTKSWSEIPVDISAMPSASTDEEKQENWWPNPTRFSKNGVFNKEFSDPVYTNSPTNYGKEGYIQIGYYSNLNESNEYISFETYNLPVTIDVNNDIYLETFDVYDESKATKLEKSEVNKPENYVLGECALYFVYDVIEDDAIVEKAIPLTDYKTVHNIGSAIDDIKEERINISNIIKENSNGQLTFNDAKFSVRVKNLHNNENTCVLLKSLTFSSETSSQTLKDYIEKINIIDATKTCCEDIKAEGGLNNYAYWSCTGSKNIYMSKIIYCSFTYDSYEANLGTKVIYDFSINDLEEYYRNGWIDWNADTMINSEGEIVINPNTFAGEILDHEKCPIAEDIKYEDVYILGYDDIHVQCKVVLYKYHGYSSMPKFLFGTDKTGRDMLKYVFEGLRTSLLLGILTFVVCFTFGLLWGSISGYFGGTVDLVMERFTDILAGVPWIVVMTLVIIHMGSNFWTFAIALCLTGWIGTAGTTRTQFYRFRGREFVLASRSLGASNPRLIAKHILPNAMGTIITSAVLMIPSVIFSEATISYLGLGLKNLSSLGVILSNNQNELTSNPYLLIFPSVIIALLMICFNLFGNGLRDAINPSLKGGEN